MLTKSETMDYTQHISWITVGLLFVLDDFKSHYLLVEALRCNYCFNADLERDCLYSSQECVYGQVCAKDATELTYTIGPDRMQQKTVWQYRMGCAATITCKDGVTFGPGPYGYSRVYRQCCCSDLCTEPDGVGKERYDHCPNAFDNVTDVAVSLWKHSYSTHNGVYSALFSWIYFFLYS